MYGASAQVDVKAVEENKRILISWDDGDELEWIFKSRCANETEVFISNRGFSGSDEEIVQKTLDSVGGFTTVLCGLKVYLEQGIRPKLIADKYPDAIALAD